MHVLRFGFLFLAALSLPNPLAPAPKPTPPPASSSPSSPPSPSASASESAPSPDSPRTSVQNFLQACHRGDFAGASAFLDVPAALDSQRNQLALHLMIVLEAQGHLHLESVSNDSQGDETDGLPPRIEQLTQLPVVGGGTAPVRMRHRETDTQSSWVFTHQTVSTIELWYGVLPGHQILDLLPPFMFRAAPLDLMLWQWLAIPPCMLLAYVVALLLRNLSQRLAGRVTGQLKSRWDKNLFAALRGPLALGWWLFTFWSLLTLLVLSDRAQSLFDHAVKALALFAFFWAAIRITNALASSLVVSPWALGHPASRSLLPLGSRVAKGLLFIFACIAIISTFGYPVTSIIAGLGIGGLAVALAAQKTMENLFGAFALGLDQPFREGDFVKVDDTWSGTVESIGLRSTQVRTPDRTVISVPNGKLADSRVETFAARDRQRFNCTVSLDYATTSQQMRTVLAGITQALKAQPKLWPGGMNVHFNGIGASSLDIDVTAWFNTLDGDEFNLIREELFLSILEATEKAGTKLALPSRALRFEGQPPAPEQNAGGLPTTSASGKEGHA
jgi:MscS family membrane protein